MSNGRLTDAPDNVDWNRIARHLIGFQQEVRDVKSDLCHVREGLDVVTMRVVLIDTGLTALRDELRALFEMHRDLRGRSE